MYIWAGPWVDGWYLWSSPCLWGHYVKSKIMWNTQTCELEGSSTDPNHRSYRGSERNRICLLYFHVRLGWKASDRVLLFPFFPSIAGINNVQGHVLIWSCDSESVCSLFSAPSHIWGHTLTVMACSSLSRTNSSVCSRRKVFIRIIRTFLSPRLVGCLVYLKQEL